MRGESKRKKAEPKPEDLVYFVRPSGAINPDDECFTDPATGKVMRRIVFQVADIGDHETAAYIARLEHFNMKLSDRITMLEEKNFHLAMKNRKLTTASERDEQIKSEYCKLVHNQMNELEAMKIKIWHLEEKIREELRIELKQELHREIHDEFVHELGKWKKECETQKLRLELQEKLLLEKDEQISRFKKKIDGLKLAIRHQMVHIGKQYHR